MVIGVWVLPGPVCPSTSPAMTRISAPPSGEESSVTSPGSRFWYAGEIIFSRLGRFTQSWMPWNRPPACTSHSGGVSMWRMPRPAVIHWVAPSAMVPPPPWESWCRKVPSMM